MSNIPDTSPVRGKDRHSIEIADETLTYRAIRINDLTPTGAQLSRAVGFKPPMLQSSS